MSDWFSSKLRAAEIILQKIDQQAAESLRKSEKGTLDGVDVDAPAGTASPMGSSVPLKEQFKKKASDGSDPGQRAVSNLASFASNSHRDSSKVVGTGSATRSNSSLARNLDVAEGDWTELLGSPTSPVAPSPQTRRNGAGGRVGRNSSATEFKRNPKMTTARMKAQKKLSPGVSSEAKVNGIEKNEGNTPSLSSEGVISLVDFQNPGKVGDSEALDGRVSIKRVTEQLVKVVSEDNVATLGFADRRLEDESCTRIGNGSQGKASSSALNFAHDVDQHGLMRSAGSSLFRDADKENNVGSDMETDSAPSSDSGSEAAREREERRRRMREKILAEKVAAKAVEYIRERENMVAKLEGEKQSLEKIVEERAKQQVKEASELQTIMMETLEAAELEKQKHNNTRMEAFARLAKLETTNAELAKALAAAQGNLEVEVKRLADLRQQIELKEVAHRDLRRRISKTRESGTSIKQESTIKTLEVERELLEAECAFIADKIGMLEQKAEHLSENIEMTRKEMEEPTEVEVELKRRLGQLTDHLIQKQAQVEALSSEKATLSFRIETVSRMLAEGKSATGVSDFASVSLDDMESGKWESSLLKSTPMLDDKLRSGKEQLWMLLRQLDAIFLAGSVYLRRYPPAKLCFVAYLACLHLWVIYIFKSHSRPSRSSAMMSLENINGN